MTNIEEFIYLWRLDTTDSIAYGNTKVPTEGIYSVPDFNREAKCGGGIHAFSAEHDVEEGCIDVDSRPIARILKARRSDVINLGGKIKVASPVEVVACGDPKELSATFDKLSGYRGYNMPLPRIHREDLRNRVFATAGNHGTAAVGHHGTAAVGHYGAATAGNKGTATAGYRGTATAGFRGTATVGNNGTATAGGYGHATAGDYATATAGNNGTATAGWRGTATAGDFGTATAGNSGTATAGNSGTATAGNHGTANAGYNGTATAGKYGTATAGYRGTATAGYHGAATAGKGGKVRLQRIDRRGNTEEVDSKIYTVADAKPGYIAKLSGGDCGLIEWERK